MKRQMKKAIYLMTFVVVAFMAVGMVSASEITWTTGPTSVTTVNDIDLTGTLVHAGTWGSGDQYVTVGGETILFKERPIGSIDDEAGATAKYVYNKDDFYKGDTGSDEFNKVMHSFAENTRKQKVTVRGLIPGNQYRIQLFTSDNRSCCSERKQKWSDNRDNNAGSETAVFTFGSSSYVIGIFVAGDTAQKIFGHGSQTKTIVNGYVLRSEKTTFYRDADKDGYGDPAVTTEACAAPEGYVADNTDCDDNDAAINPKATEVCDGVDNDCDGLVDEGVKLTFYRDADGDTYGNAVVTTEACAAPEGYVADNTDCDDNDAARFPGNPEVCDRKDNDCDGVVPLDEIDNNGDGMTECEAEIAFAAETERADDAEDDLETCGEDLADVEACSSNLIASVEGLGLGLMALGYPDCLVLVDVPPHNIKIKDKWNLNWSDSKHGDKALKCEISVCDEIETKIHTSGSKPLVAGITEVGEFLVTGVTDFPGESKKHNKVQAITVKFTGTGPVDIGVYTKKHELVELIEGVETGEEITVDGSGMKKGHLDHEVVFVYQQACDYLYDVDAIMPETILLNGSVGIIADSAKLKAKVSKYTDEINVTLEVSFQKGAAVASLGEPLEPGTYTITVRGELDFGESFEAETEIEVKPDKS